MNERIGDGDYWRLREEYQSNKTELFERAKALGCTRTIDYWTRAKLACWLRRRERRLPNYDQCSDAEFCTFVRQRGLSIVSPVAEERRFESQEWSLRIGALEALEEADDKSTFRHFLDLPPELRKRVYELYDEEFPHLLTAPSKPPLARTCHLMRQEVLPIFYANHRIELYFDHTREADGSRRISQRNETQLFLLHMRPEDLQYLNEIRIVTEWDGCDEMSFSMTLMKASRFYLIDIEFLSGDTVCTVARCPYEDILEWQLRELLDAMVARGGMLKFTAYDIHSLRWALQRAWSDFDEWND